MIGGRTLAILLFFLALAVVFTAPLSLEPGGLAANDGDPLHISWIVAWDAHQVVRSPLHLFDSNTFYPYRSSLAFSEHMIVPALLGAPVFYATGNALLTQNVLVVLTLGLSGFTMFLLMRQLLGNDFAAVVAGLVYAFQSYGFHEVARLQLLSVQWWPLAVLYLHRGFTEDEGRSRNAAASALFFTLQGLSCTYYLFYFSLALALWIPVYALTRTGGLSRLVRFVAPFAVAGLVFVLFALPYLAALRSFGYERPLVAGADLLAFLAPPEGTLLARFLRFDFEPGDVPQFLGLLPLGLAAVGLVRRTPGEDPPRRVFFWLAVATAVLGLVLSLGPTLRFGGHELGSGPYAWLYRGVPFFRVLRNAERLSVLTHFGVAALAGFGAAALPLPAAARVLLLVLLPLEHFQGGQPFTPIPVGESLPAVYPWLGAAEGHGAVVELPLYPREQLRRHALYMLFSTYHWKPIVFGRTSFYPPATGMLAWEMRGFPDETSLGLLEALGVERLVVHPGIWPAEERPRRLALLNRFGSRLAPEGRFPPLSDPVAERYGLGGERVFRLTRSGEAPRTEELCVPADEIATTGWTVRGDGATPAEWAIDRDPATMFRTERQLPGMKLELDLGAVEEVAAVRVDLGYPHDQFPRDLTLKASDSGSGFERIEFRDDVVTKWETVRALIEDPEHAAMTLRFAPVEIRRLRLWIREGKPWDFALPHWSLPELHLYRRCEASPP